MMVASLSIDEKPLNCILRAYINKGIVKLKKKIECLIHLGIEEIGISGKLADIE